MSEAMQKQDGVFTPLIALQEKADTIRERLPQLSDEQLKTLFQALEGASSIAWQLQADIVAQLLSSATYGTNAIEQIAKFLQIEERRAWELAQIHNEILAQKPELRELPLDKGHYLAALRGKKKGKNPVELLEHAASNLLGVRQLQRYIKGVGETKMARIEYFALSKAGFEPRSDMIQKRYLSPSARIVEINGVDHLELKQYEDEP